MGNEVIELKLINIPFSEMYLGPVHPGFQFQPKHKSNAYEAEG